MLYPQGRLRNCTLWYADMQVVCSFGSSAKTQVHQVAKDISGHGNDLPLVRPPRRHDMTVDKVRQLAPFY